MSDTLKVDLCIIGAGSGGLSVAAGAVQMGASVALIEKHKMGGDCLNYGCVPSKALLAAAKHAHAHRTGEAFGIAAHEPEVDFPAVMDHVASVIAAIAPHDSVERFEGLGCTVIQDAARFTGPRTVEAGGKTIEARRVVISTGSSPFVPPIPGLEDTPYFTNETIFENREQPSRLIVIGGGPIGMEMAQAHMRLGSEVVVLEGSKALGKDDPDITAIALRRLRAEGLDIREEAMAERVEKTPEGVRVHLKGGETVDGSHLLMAVGRKPNVDGLDLEKAGIKYSNRGIEVNDNLVTSNKKVFAIGDVTGGLQFTHVAGYHAGVVIRNALFQMFWAKASTAHIPWVTYIDPEVAQVGMTEAEASAKFGAKASTLRWSLEENDRAQAERETEGLVKVMLNGTKIVGASIVGKGAGEMIQVWAYAIANGQKIGSIAGYVAPYPTYGEAGKRAAGQHYVPTLYSDRTKGIVRFLSKFG
jgi:pyruvate/2-oxoglutarate dehydrogenase complex dihydrolipoamide dehydrogenase (E3) component